MPSKRERDRIDAVISDYALKKNVVSQFLKVVVLALGDSDELSRHVHSIKSRVKSEASLRDKLYRKLADCKTRNKPFNVTKDNLLYKITDLAGIRILHLHTRQFSSINTELLAILKEQKYNVKEGPFARTWDDESRAFFREQHVQIEDSETLYTSVHYVIESASRTKVTCEIQVRTLMEEVWGEVDHAINYPHASDSVACREQIKALARSTSATTRLVDSIFATLHDLRYRGLRRNWRQAINR